MHRLHQILLVLDNPSEEAHTLHILSKYHFCNSTLRIRKVHEAWSFFTAASAGKTESGNLPELIILSISENSPVQASLAQESRKADLGEVPLIVVAENREEEEAIRKLNLPKTYCLVKPLGYFKLLEGMQKLGMFWLVMRASPADQRPN